MIGRSLTSLIEIRAIARVVGSAGKQPIGIEFVHIGSMRARSDGRPNSVTAAGDTNSYPLMEQWA